MDRAWLESIAQDVTYALRNFRWQPGFALVAIATLASAIGLITSLFNVFNAIAFRPWPVENPGRVVQIFNMNRADLLSRAGGQPYGFSLAEVRGGDGGHGTRSTRRHGDTET